MTQLQQIHPAAWRRGFSRRCLEAGASLLVLMAAAAAPAVAGSLKGAVSAQGTAAAAASATSATQTQTAAAIAAAAASNANLTKATQALKAAIAAQTAAARAVSSFNGLGAGALQPATSSCASCLDTTWTGADQPTQTVNTDGTYDVSVNQTQARAVLSWESFNVGSKTTLTFDQQGNSAWIVLNRVVGASASPSQILGTVKADGTVLVINQNGIVFGAGAQINVHSLIASTLEVGRTVDSISSINTLRTLAERNAEFLDYGLTGYSETKSTSFTSIGAYPTFSGTTDGAVHNAAAVTVEQGATVTASDGGMILLAAPTVSNAGFLSADDGQVSLVGVTTRLTTFNYATPNAFTTAQGSITLAETNGSAESKDPYVRGYLVVGGDGTVINTATGVIEADRGYISLGGYSSALISGGGTVTNDGVLASTTAVSANGTIDLLGDTITLGAGSIILIGADGNGETITQDADSIAAFKRSQVRVGAYFSNVTMGNGAMIVAPSGNVTLGAPSGKTLYAATGVAGTITLESGAVIDVGGLKDVLIPVSAYNLSILLKGNELADSGGYQDSFLNGKTVWIDARLSGVRDDGVAWIGSPLLSVESYYEAVGVSAAQLMTTGGNVTLGTSGALTGASAAGSSRVVVKSGASIDISGGWVTYEAGTIKTTRLVTSSGTVVDIGAADPLSDTYVAVYTGATTSHGHWGVTSTYNSVDVATNSWTEASYSEGRDAGTLTIKSAQVVYEGRLDAAAYAGIRQIAASVAGTASSDVYGDSRAVQAATTQLPSGGMLFIQAVGDPSVSTVGGGGDIKVVAAADYAREDGVTVLSDSLLSTSGLAQVSLWSSGAISVARGATISLKPGGVFDAYSGRSITINGTITVPSGSIVLETADFGLNGSMFTDSDNALVVGAFDVTVTGTLSVAGEWVNDYGKSALEQEGDAYLDAGSITIVTAASVSDNSTGSVANTTTALTSGATATDVSGSIYLRDADLIDLSGGGRVTATGALELTGRGGSLSLINQTAFHQLEDANLTEVFSASLYGRVSGFRVNHATASGMTQSVQINPGEITSTVQFNPDVIRAAGFSGGGTFTVWAPDITFGSGSADDTALATALPLSFFQAGFSTYSLTSYKTLLADNTFVSSGGASLGGTNAILQTQTFHVRAGETLTLSQALLPTELTVAETAALKALASGGDVTSVLSASVPAETWDQQAVNLTLNGMVELVVDSGGTINAAPGATLTVAKLLNEGTIRLPGGTIVQSQTLPEIFATDSVTTLYAVRALSDIFTVEADGSIVETAGSKVAGKSNADVAYNSLVYLLGTLGADDGIVLAAGSVTDLSGVSVINPHTAIAGTRTGTVYAGGTLALAAESVTADSGYYRASALSTHMLSVGSTVLGKTLTIAGGASLALDGAADTYTQGGVATAVWSDAGTISAPNGFTISSAASLSAHGGAASAEGGTLELADVILTQSNADAAGELAADQITAAGFTSLAALGTLGSDGDVVLTLGKAFYLASRPYAGTSAASVAVKTTNAYATTISAGGDLTITAPYIGLLSSVDELEGGTTTGTVAGHGVTLTATKAFDVAGAVLFDRSVSHVALSSGGDFRLVGAGNYLVTYGLSTTENTALTALLATNGALTLSAAQLYPTTGTSATISATGAVTFARSTATLPDTPYSAGASLMVKATDILQGGVIRVPLGELTLDASGALTLAAGSVTSVSADGLSIPYGTTTDGKEWYFTPTGGTALVALPAKVLTLSGATVEVKSGASVDLSGGGDFTAYEFSAGTGGSRDVLSASNDDSYTSKTGCTYTACAQAYAIVPGLSDAAVAAYDPVYSSNYSALSSVSGVGTRVQLDLGGGLKWYTLLPAQYATLPGGKLVVVRGATPSVAAGTTTTLADGTILATGTFGNALSGSSGSTVYTVAVQSEGVYGKYSSITLTSGNAYFTALAEENDTTLPRLALDAGRLVLDASSRLVVDSVLKTAAASGGRGAQVDIGGDAIALVADLPADTSGALYITAGSVTNLNAESVLIGGTRTDNDDGTTTLAVSAGSVRVANDADHAISAAEILLAATGSVSVADGAVITATGSLSDAREGAYLLGDTASSGTGALLRVANGPERLTRRTNFTSAASLGVGAATLTGTSVMFDSSGSVALSNALVLNNATSVALAAGRIGLGITDASYNGVVVTPQMQALLTQSGGRLTLRSQSSIDFADGTYSFGDVRLDAATLAGTEGGAVVIAGDTVTLSNAGASGIVCVSCAANAGTLAIEAETVLFSGGVLATQATTTQAAATATLTYDVKVTLKAGTDITTTNGSVTLTEDATILIPAGTAVTLASGSGVITPTEASGTVAAGTGITVGNLTYTLAAGQSYTFAAATTTQVGSQTYSNGAGSRFTLASATAVTVPTGAGLTLSDAVAVASTDFFAGGVTLSASKGIIVTGKGAGLDAGSAALTLHTPYLGDRASTASAGAAVIPDLTLATRGALVIDSQGAASLDLSSLGGTAGTGISITGGSVSISGTTVHASAGTLAITADGSIALGDGAVVEAPGLTTSYGDGTDGTTANSAAGTVSLTAKAGDIDLRSGSTVSVANSGGAGGRLALSAVAGAILFDGTIDGTAASGSTGGTFALDTGGAVDLVALNTKVAAHGFTGGFEVHSHRGNLTLAAGETLTSGSVKLTADGGFVIIGGTIDTSGAKGGDIGLYGNQGVSVLSTAVLDARADGYADTDTRQASAGTITLATDFVTGTTSTDADGMVSGTSGVILVQRGATLNLAATRSYARLVALSSGTGYTYVDADTAGTLVIRAPVVTDATGNPTVRVTVESADSVQGAAAIEVEGFTRWDLVKVAASGHYTGVTVDAGGTVTLDVSAGLDTLAYDSVGKTFTVRDAGSGLNFLADVDSAGTHATLVSVIQDFDLSAAATGSGGLAALATAYGDEFVVAPGVDLVSTGNLTLASNWNLAAGVVDTTRAVANGLMGSESYNGSTVNYIKSGNETTVLENYTGMLYRTGGRVTGVAPILTLRAGGDLAVNGIVTDGYFSFEDTSNPTYLLSQTGANATYTVNFGGGVSAYNAVGTSDRSLVWSTDSTNSGYKLTLWGSSTTYGTTTTYGTGSSVAPDPLDYVPYSPDANSAAPPQTRNSFSSMDLFPTLDGDAQMSSASYRLVAGAKVGRDAGGALTASADPMSLDPLSVGSVSLNGYSYTTASGVKSVEVKYYTFPNRYEYDCTGSSDYCYSSSVWLAKVLDNKMTSSATYTSNAVFWGTNSSYYLDSASGGSTANGTILVSTSANSAYKKIDSVSDLVYIWIDLSSANTGLALNKSKDGNYGWTTVSFRDYVKSGADSYLYNLYYGNLRSANASNDYFTVVGNYGGATTNPYVTTDNDTISLLVSVKTLEYILKTYIDPVFPSTVGGATTTTVVPAMVRTGTGDIGIAAAGTVNLTGTNGTAAVYTTGRQATGASTGTTTATVIATDGTTTGTATINLGAYLGNKGFYLVDGGDITITALGSVHGSSSAVETGNSNLTTSVSTTPDREIDATAFSGAVGVLGGGDVSVTAGRDLDDVAVVSMPAIRTVAVTLADGTAAKAIDYLGETDLTLRAGRDIRGGGGWVTAGSVTIAAGRDIASAGYTAAGKELLTTVRILNATAGVIAGRDASLYFGDAIGWSPSAGWGSWYSDGADLSVIANGDLAMSVAATTLASSGTQLTPLPGSVSLVAVAGDLDFLTYGNSNRAQLIMLPSADGQLVLLAGGAIGAVTLVMDDADPAKMPGPFVALVEDAYTVRGLGFPTVTSATTEAVRRLYHNEDITHWDDARPVIVMAGGDIESMTLVTPKQTRVVAGGDIVDMVFFGQNLHPTDVTRIAAGGAITATSTISNASYYYDSTHWGTESRGEATLGGNLFVIGGPGSFFLEAGGDIGPFLNSAIVTVSGSNNGTFFSNTYTYAGGVLSVGYDWNPWLKATVTAAGGGADLYVMFGLGATGPDYAALAEKYVNPANAAALTYGGYAATLVEWMEGRYGLTGLTEAEAYAAFLALPAADRHVFLLSKVYFNELEQVAVTTSASYQVYSRGYTAVNTMFPAANGYTGNGLEGGAVETDRVHTGDLDLRLAAIETTRGGDIRILGPGGDILAGSVVRTSTQAARRNYAANLYAGSINRLVYSVDAIPTAYEGIITLRGGTISTFTDGSLILNQSRLFTENGGDIVAWSSNGDLNAGQGPKTSVNFTPIVIRHDWDLHGEVDPSGSVSGAGIAAFEPEAGVEAPDVYLLAPRGLVDAGDAGIRVAGDISIVAYQVRNTDNIQVGGTSSGLPVAVGSSLGAVLGASDTAAQAAGAAEDAARAIRPAATRVADLPSIIVFEVLGYGGAGGSAGAEGPDGGPRRRPGDISYDPDAAVRVVGLGGGR